MTDILFYPDTPDKLAFACRFAARGQGAGRRLALLARDAAAASALDTALWTFDPLAFVPHARAGHRLAGESPVLILAADDVSLADCPIDDVLINLSGDVPAGFERFAMLIEPIGRDDADRHAGRQRWSTYKSRGFEPQVRAAGKGSPR